MSVYDPDGIESLPTLVYSSNTVPLRIALLMVIRAGTSHIAAADDSGLAISAITTVNTYFGSKVMVPETGVVMNNEMDGK